MCVAIHESCMLTQQGTVYHAHMKTSTVQLPVDEYFKKSRLDIILGLQFSYIQLFRYKYSRYTYFTAGQICLREFESAYIYVCRGLIYKLFFLNPIPLYFKIQ